MNIQFAEPVHIPALLSLLGQVLRVHHAIRPDLFRAEATKYDEAGLTAMLRDENSPIFVAVEGRQVLGYCFCQLRNVQSSVFTPRRELYIDDLCVDEAFRGRGIAGALYRHTLNYAKDRGCGYVTLNVWSGNDAQQFYEKMGMTPRSITMETKLC